MKILSVTTAIPSVHNAAWWRISNIAAILRSSGHEVDFVHYIRKPTLDKLDNIESLKGHSFFITSPLTDHVTHLKVLLKNKYDLVYGNTHGGAFCSLLSKLTKTPLVFDMHGGLIEEYLLQNKFNFNLSWLFYFIYLKLKDSSCLRFSDKIICVSHKMIELLYSKGIPSNKVSYVTNGVDLDFFKPPNNKNTIDEMRRTLGIEDKLVFGYIGDFQKWQGVEYFINAAKKINNSNVAFLIVGGEKKIIKNNIIFLPRVKRNAIVDYYSICDILVLPRPNHLSTQIAAPTKFAEYTAMAKPILTTDVGDAADFVKQYNCGIVIKNTETTNMIEGIMDFKDFSNNELIALGNNSRRLAENEFNWEVVRTKLLNVLNHI